jgi:hypothetical protein
VPVLDLSKYLLCPRANFQAPLCPFVLLYLRDEIRPQNSPTQRQAL